MVDTYFEECPDKPTPKEIEELVWAIFEREFDRSLQHIKKDIEQCMRNFIQFEQKRLLHWKSYKPTFTERTLKNDKYLCIVDFHNDEEGISIGCIKNALPKVLPTHNLMKFIESL